MGWNIERVYAAASAQSIERCKAASIHFELLTPPDVSTELIVLRQNVSDLAAFRDWCLESPTLIEPTSLEGRCPADAGIPCHAVPARERLLEAKWFAETLGVTAAFYRAETFGGIFDFEFAWEFGARERVLARGTRAVAAERSTRKRWLFFKTDLTIRTVWEDWIFEITKTDCFSRSGAAATGGVLRYLMPSFGIESPTGYFKPHARTS